MFIDTHCHLEGQYYTDIADIIKKSTDLEVKTLITAGCDDASNKEMLKLINNYSNVYACLGIHPEFANDYQEADLTFIKENLDNKKVLAIGEIGLDYHYEGYNKEGQIALLKKQLSLAKEYHLPVVIHSRDATMDTLNILKEFKVKGIIHSFSGSKETAIEYIKMGYKLGINGVVTFKNAHLKEIIKEVGLENFVLETDSPYLTPEPYRGKQNFPGNIKYIADFLANYLELSPNKIAEITSTNAYDIFDKLPR